MIRTTLNEVTVTCFNVLSENWSGYTEEEHVKTKSTVTGILSENWSGYTEEEHVKTKSTVTGILA
jgi:hypothetical protein